MVGKILWQWWGAGPPSPTPSPAPRGMISKLFKQLMEEMFKGIYLNLEVVLMAEHGIAPFDRSTWAGRGRGIFW